MVVNNIYNNLAYLKSLNTRETRGTHFTFDALEKKTYNFHVLRRDISRYCRFKMRFYLILLSLEETLLDIAPLKALILLFLERTLSDIAVLRTDLVVSMAKLFLTYKTNLLSTKRHYLIL